MASWRTFAVGVLVVLFAAPIAKAGYGDPNPPPASGSPSSDRSVNANGNPFSGGLAFDPAHVKAKVGQSVSWTNTDNIVPHTSTEDHRLWELSGDYGPPGNMGYGPGEKVQRRFAAGTWSYYCAIHPDDMRGTVAVPVTLKRLIVGTGPPAGPVLAIWATEDLPAGQVFDVQERVGGKPWRTIRNGTRQLHGTFRAQEGQTLSFRARVRRITAPKASSGYSPAARIKIG